MKELLDDHNEAGRIAALEALNLLDTPADELFDRHTRLLHKLTGWPIVAFGLIDSDRVWFKSAQGIATPLVQSRLASPCAQTITETGIHRATCGDGTEAITLGDQSVLSYLGIAIRDQAGHAIGTLSLQSPQERAEAAHESELLTQVASLVEYDIHLAQRSTLDSLTGLSNLAGFEHAARHILALCNRSQCEATLVVFELQDLASINAEHGHEAGDLVLSAFGKLLASTFRTSDIVARVSGGTFHVLLSHGDNVDFLIPIDRLREKLKDFNASLDMPSFMDVAISHLHFEGERHKNIEGLLNAKPEAVSV